MDDEELIDRTTDTIYRHVKRTDWGHAIVAFHGDDRSVYQFEDGKTRTIHSKFQGLLEPVDKPRDQSLEIVRSLKAMLRASGAWSGKDAPDLTLDELMSLGEQVGMFRLLYPGGFDDEEYQSSRRGADQSRHLKRYRDGAVKEAQTRLSAKALNGRAPGEVFDKFMAVVASTDLVPARDSKDLLAATPDSKRKLAESLVELLYGDGAYTDRLTGWMAALRTALGRPAGWEVTTFISALVYPQDHVCVKPSAFKDQAKWMAPSLRFRAQPKPRIYTRLLRMADEVREHLQSANVPPKDLLDVYNFIWETQRPAAKDLLTQVRARGVADAAE